MPIAVNIAAPRLLNAGIVAVHCLPLPLLLPLLLFGDWRVAIALAVAVAASLVFHLRRQRLAVAAARLEGNVENEWFLYRDDGKSVKVSVLGQVNFGWYVLVLLQQNRRKFRVLIKCAGQSREQLHRLKVMRVRG